VLHGSLTCRNVEEELDADNVFVVEQPLERQAMEVAADDAAIEDTLESLDKAVEAGIVAPDVYLKHVRALCREQFFKRALGEQIAVKRSISGIHTSFDNTQTPTYPSMSTSEDSDWVHLRPTSNYPTL